MPTEGATTIAQLDKDNPSSTAPAGEGDDHLRMLKEVLIASFPALDGLITNSVADGTAGNVDPPDAATFSRLFSTAFTAFAQRVPVGGIMMWSGTVANIPAGWFLCDGTNNTPNLIDRFILGANDDTSNYPTGQSGGEPWGSNGLYYFVQGTPSISDSVTVNGDTGTINVSLDVEDHIHGYLPPFYALAFIQYQGV